MTMCLLAEVRGRDMEFFEDRRGKTFLQTKIPQDPVSWRNDYV